MNLNPEKKVKYKNLPNKEFIGMSKSSESKLETTCRFVTVSSTNGTRTKSEIKIRARQHGQLAVVNGLLNHFCTNKIKKIERKQKTKKNINK